MPGDKLSELRFGVRWADCRHQPRSDSGDAAAVRVLESLPSTQLIWASPRELLNIYHAEEIGCHVITVTNDILKKLPLIGKDLNEYSLGTVRMFYDDAQRAGFTLDVGTVV